MVINFLVQNQLEQFLEDQEGRDRELSLRLFNSQARATSARSTTMKKKRL
jgi:hypothetical protein